MVESQAIGRVLRIGQGRDVKVVRYSVKGTIEEVGPTEPAAKHRLTI
jgi:SNF2 family DNA or RNA helicase